MRLLLTLLLVIAAAAAGPGSLDAQAIWGGEAEPGALEGVLRGRPAVPLAEARSRCVPIAPPTPPGAFAGGPRRQFSTTCRVTEFKAGRRGDGSRFWYAAYRWTHVMAAWDASRGPAARDTLVEGETVLFEGVGTDRVRPVWGGRYPREYYSSLDVETVPAPGGGLFLSMMVCVNGTAGCTQDLLVRRGGRWAAVRYAFLDRFRDRLVAGRQVGAVEVFTGESPLRAVATLTDDDDPRCCPSGMLEMWVALRGNSLVLLRHRVQVEEEEP